MFPCPQAIQKKNISLENRFIKRSISITPHLGTSSITNKLDGKSLKPTGGGAFVVYLADGTQLTASDFTVVNVDHQEAKASTDLTIRLDCQKLPLKATVHYSLKAGDFYTRKHLTLTPGKAMEVKKSTSSL